MLLLLAVTSTTVAGIGAANSMQGVGAANSMQGVGAANSMQSFASACVAIPAITCVARHTRDCLRESTRPRRRCHSAGESFSSGVSSCYSHYILLTAVCVCVWDDVCACNIYRLVSVPIHSFLTKTTRRRAGCRRVMVRRHTTPSGMTRLYTLGTSGVVC